MFNVKKKSSSKNKVKFFAHKLKPYSLNALDISKTY